MATSSILKTRAVERMRQKWKIAAFVVPVVPKKGMFCVAEDSRQVWFAAVKSPRTESAFAALPMLTENALTLVLFYPTSLSTIADPL